MCVLQRIAICSVSVVRALRHSFCIVFNLSPIHQLENRFCVRPACRLKHQTAATIAAKKTFFKTILKVTFRFSIFRHCHINLFIFRTRSQLTDAKHSVKYRTLHTVRTEYRHLHWRTPPPTTRIKSTHSRTLNAFWCLFFTSCGCGQSITHTIAKAKRKNKE